MQVNVCFNNYKYTFAISCLLLDCQFCRCSVILLCPQKQFHFLRVFFFPILLRIFYFYFHFVLFQHCVLCAFAVFSYLLVFS